MSDLRGFVLLIVAVIMGFILSGFHTTWRGVKMSDLRGFVLLIVAVIMGFMFASIDYFLPYPGNMAMQYAFVIVICFYFIDKLTYHFERIERLLK